MAIRRGLGVGRGRGYKNIIYKDPVVHSQSARGIKQPQMLMMLKTARPLTKTLKNLQNFEEFKQGKYEQLEPYIFRRHNTIIKNRQTERAAKEEAKLMNDVANEFPYYPYAIVREHKGNWYVIVSRVYGDNLSGLPMQKKLNTNQKFQLAKVTRFLFNKGYVDMDIRGANVVIDKKKNAVFVDFGDIRKLSPKESEYQYNLNILSIFGFRDNKSRHFLTKSLKQMGLVL